MRLLNGQGELCSGPGKMNSVSAGSHSLIQRAVCTRKRGASADFCIRGDSGTNPHNSARTEKRKGFRVDEAYADIAWWMLYQFGDASAERRTFWR